MSKLVDKYLFELTGKKATEIDKIVLSGYEIQPGIATWCIAKPLGRSLCLKEIISRINDAIRILKGTSFALHYKEDEAKTFQQDKGK